MSRLIFSNDNQMYIRLKKDYNKYFYLNDEFNETSCNVATFKKLRKETHNIYVNKNNFIAISGTFFYDKLFGEKSLAKLLRDFNDCDIDEIIPKTFGNFSAVIKKDAQIYFFIDNTGIYNLYYFIDNDHITITNIFYNLAKNIGSNMTINEQALLEDSFQYSILGDDSLVVQIKRVQGNYIYTYDLESKKLVLNEKQVITSKHINKDLDESAKYLSELIKEKASIITNNFDNIAINMTGGLDSRLILSAFLSLNVKPVIIYGIGNSPLTNTKEEDLRIDELYSKRFNLDFYKMNWRTNENFMDDWGSLLEKYGEFFGIYGGNINIFEEYENKVSNFTDFTEFGYFGETLRNLDSLEKSKELFDTNYFTNDLYLYNNTNLGLFMNDVEKYRENVENKIKYICKTFNINPEKITKDDFQKIHTEYRKRADSVMSNFINNIMFSTVLLSEYEIQNFINTIPFEWKKDARFQLKVIYYTYPQTLEIPFFSHIKEWTFDQEYFKLKPANKSYLNFEMFIKKHIKNESILNKLKQIKRTFSKVSKESNVLKNNVAELVNKLQKELNLNLIHAEKYEGNISALIRYCQNLYMLKNIFDKMPLTWRDDSE